ncbi:hypothetical protein G9A89_005539 [Geosiphon pyriformis]|nr:hypothetical protein G9A89_005539 [Geosiphon pyriformis]
MPRPPRPIKRATLREKRVQEQAAVKISGADDTLEIKTRQVHATLKKGKQREDFSLPINLEDIQNSLKSYQEPFIEIPSEKNNSYLEQGQTDNDADIALTLVEASQRKEAQSIRLSIKENLEETGLESADSVQDRSYQKIDYDHGKLHLLSSSSHQTPTVKPEVTAALKKPVRRNKKISLPANRLPPRRLGKSKKPVALKFGDEQLLSSSEDEKSAASEKRRTNVKETSPVDQSDNVQREKLEWERQERLRYFREVDQYALPVEYVFAPREEIVSKLNTLQNTKSSD